MTSQTASRSATLADVLDVVARADVNEKRRAEITSSLRTIARALNRPLDQISADANALRRRLDEVSPLAMGLSTGRWANVRSHLRSALHLAKGQLPRAKRPPLSAPWVELVQRLSHAGQIRVGRLLRFLSELQIEPADVRSEHLEQFHQSLLSDALITNPEKTWRLAVGVWNSSARQIPDWPARELHLTPLRETYSLPWTAFPSTFKADADAFLASMSGNDLLEVACRPVRPSTIETRRRQILASASALVHRGKDPSSIRTLADLVELENFKEILRFFLKRRGDASSSTMIENLARFLKSVARHWVKASPDVLANMSTIIKNVTVAQNGMTPKNRDRLAAFKNEKNVQALLHLPSQLMREAATGRQSKPKSALLAQTAVAIELLLMRPLRIENLAALELYRHIVETKKGAWYVVIPAEEVKNNVDLEHDLPAESRALLDRYLRDFRPALAQAGNAALFPGRKGFGTKSIGTLRGQITKTIHTYTGLRMHPHLFRHLAGFIHLTEHPGEYLVVTQVLDHKSINTAMRYYTGMENAAAFSRYDKTVIGVKDRGGQSVPKLNRRLRRTKPLNPNGEE